MGDRDSTAVVVPRLAERPTIKDAAYRTLRRLILDGDIPPGYRLIESELTQQLGVSKTPLREAMLMLQADALVTIVPRQSARVTNMSLAEYEELQFIRDALEFAALDLVVQRITAPDLATAGQALATMERAMAAGNGAEYLLAQHQLFESLIAPCGLPRLTQMLLDHFAAMGRVSRFAVFSRPEWWAKDLETGRQRLQSVAQHDTSAAREAVRAWHAEFIGDLKRAIRENDPQVVRLFRQP